MKRGFVIALLLIFLMPAFIFAQERVLITVPSGQYVTAINGGGMGEAANALPLHTDATKIGPWERFTLIRVDQIHFAIRTPDNRHYLTAVNGGGIGEAANTLPLHSDARSAGAWETFFLVPLGGEVYAIRTPDGRHYLTAVNSGGIGEAANTLPFHTDATQIGPWEKFRIIRH